MLVIYKLKSNSVNYKAFYSTNIINVIKKGSFINKEKTYRILQETNY